MAIEIENRCVQYVIGSDGRNLHFVDRGTGEDYCVREPRSPFARVKQGGRYYDASSVSYADGRGERTKGIRVEFGESGICAAIQATVQDRYFILEVVSVRGEQVEELVFADLALTLQGAPEEPFAACALALNLQTNVPEIPGPNRRLRAACYPRFGFSGAKVALIGCPQSTLREVMQEVVSHAEELPHSSIGGPWAWDVPINRGSYLFNFGDVTEETVGDWIRLVQSLGFNQLDFHGGRSFRFGDCRPDPEMYPRGLDSLKAVIHQLHASGIMAGLHTYAFFIDKGCPWVTPVPDPRLGKDATFTLAEPLTPEATTVPVIESTEEMSTTTGFFVRNSVTLQIDDELITYAGIAKEPPYAFTGCERGAYGTRVAPHDQGAEVHHLKECFGLFTPDGDSSLLADVAASTAEVFNTCDFDMMYLDALDGEDILGGRENGWHYGSKFVFELWKRLKKPALMEMSTFHHHLWFVRSRMGAWDHPMRSHKKFIDIHCEANQSCRRMFLPGHLGWWAVKTWSGAQGEPTFPDDIEYLCGKALGTDTGWSLMGIDPSNIHKTPAFSRLAEIIKQYESLRHADYFSETMKAQLRKPGKEFTLIQSPSGTYGFRPVRYAKHKVEGMDGWSNVWKIHHTFERQPVGLRIEALMGVGPYDAPEHVMLADFRGTRDFPDRATAEGVCADLQPSSDQVKVGSISGCYTATSRRLAATSASGDTDTAFSPTDHGVRTLHIQDSAWTKMAKRFSPPLHLSQHQGLGIWVYGDGKGEVLNVQVRSPEHVSTAIGEHYVIVDFTGWRYFELIEPEGQRYSDYVWPYGPSVYHIYRECVRYEQVEFLGLWYNHLPPNDTVTCYLSPIKALPLVKATLRHPAVTIGDRRIVFPTEIESGCYLEFRSVSDCVLFGPQGEVIREVVPEGDVPVLEAGANPVEFACDVQGGVNARAYVTVISQGKPLGGE